MITMISLLKRRDDMSLEAFLAWYDQHAAAATRIEGLRRYTVNRAAHDGQDWDAVSMLTFDDTEAMTAALNGPEGARSRADTLAHVSRREVLVMHQREVDVPHPR